ncbi:ParB/RepB/Spo0J family partition protein [Fulvivirgaceae bacterium BMA12]|uniref:ParB/RepB/Spo0J family partition protein n=1 Tax=Agaribacillus aureus TaxID=3051825 RepID=A0ABT8L8H4_9BACT|nr:ParB/RepB/Spo0J family partition protein [Fulvivirgaceae bacterium BMA12]
MTAKKTPKRRNALGRGLGALLDDTPSTEDKLLTDASGSGVNRIDEIDIDLIEVNPYQPRNHFDEEALQELADSIGVQGIIQPITVRKLADDNYQIISGERRFQASRLAGLETIPAYIRVANDQQMLEMALIENIQREDLNALEIALSYQRLLSECELKQEELGDRVGKKRSTVNNYLRLLKLPPDIQAALRDKKISMGHARALINIESIEKQLNIFKQVLAQDLSVRKTEALVRALTEDNPSKEPSPKTSNELSYEMKEVRTRLSSHFGTKVELIAKDKNRGEIKIPYVSVEDLNRILEIIEI